MYDNRIATLLECLIDEIRTSGDPSERTVMVLAEYEDEYPFVAEYFQETE